MLKSEAVTYSFLFKDYIPLITSSVVILLFIIERVLSFKIRKKEVKRSWYYKIHIDPNLDKIDIFFEDVKVQFEKSLLVLRENMNKPNVSDFRAFENGKFQRIKREFELNIILPIISSNNEIGQELTETLQLFEDFYIELLDSSLENKNLKIIQKCSEVKTDWYRILFNPIK